VELGRTVEKYSRPNTKKGITKEQHITQSLLYRWNWVGLLKNTLRPNTKKGITKEQHHQPCFIGGMGRTVEKYSKTKHKERNHKEQHITQSLLYRWELGRTVEKYLRSNTKKGITKEQHITTIPAL
jgi:hypothetical protein